MFFQRSVRRVSIRSTESIAERFMDIDDQIGELKDKLILILHSLRFGVPSTINTMGFT